MSIHRKNIKILIVWLAGLIITAHGIVPHHHHFDSVFSHVENEPCTPGHDEEEKQEEDGSQHCHAFNESIIDWVDYSKINFHPLTQLLEIILIIPEILEQFNNSYFEYHFTYDISPYIHFIFYGSPLRAPPAFK